MKMDKKLKTKYVQILADALDFYPSKVSEIMDQLDAIINKTSDEGILKDLYYVWNELDALKIDLVNCAKFFNYFFKKGDQ